MNLSGKAKVSQRQVGASAACGAKFRHSCLACLLGWAISSSLHAGTVEAAYNSPYDVPITASSYTATGNDIHFTLNFAPATGTSLVVITCTGPGFIQGTFSNLPQGEVVVLSHAGQNYYFIANYYAHEGRNLMLQWANVKPMAWGSGANGKLGNDSTSDSSMPVPVNTADALWGKLPAAGAAGVDHSLGLCADGTVVAWGGNTNGQLGNGSTTQSTVPVAVTIPGVPSTRIVVAVAAGASHSLALCSDGTVFAWGLNTNGQLGNSSTNPSTVPVAVTTASGALLGKSVVAISAGASHSLALCSDGAVAAWGLNANGQLGNNIPTQSTAPVAVTNTSGALLNKTVVAISAGGGHSLALCSNGTVAAWGLNTNGQLGNSNTNPSTLPVAVTTSSGALLNKTVAHISAGGSHSLALCDDGTLAAWGLNTSGQLGNNSNTQSSVPVAVWNSSGVLNGKSVLALSAGASHSLALYMDGSMSAGVAAWGLNSSGQLGDQSTNSRNTPVMVNTSWLGSGVFTGIVSGPSANHSLSIVAAPEIDVSNFGIQKLVTYDQSSTADPTLDPDSPYMFLSYVNSSTMGALLSSSTLTPSPGSPGAGIYQPGSNGLQLRKYFRTQAAMDADFKAGIYSLKIRTSTPNTYDTQLTLGPNNYPATPKITNVTNAAWIGGALKITNRSQPVTITWSNPSLADSYFQIDNTDINSGNFSQSTSFTIPGDSLDDNFVCRGSIQLVNGAGGSGTSIPGLPGADGNSTYQTRVQFLILTGNASVSESPFYYVLLKNHILAQSSNSAPVDGPSAIPDTDLAPYALTLESPVSGTVTGPGSTSFLLGFYADNDGSSHEYYSSPVASSTLLNNSYPNGQYTFPGSRQVNLTGDGYPAATQILTVNGATPVWDAQGELALDPTINNTITWSTVSVPNFATNGHQGVFIEHYDDYNFINIEEERGFPTGFTTPITSLLIPKFSMTATYTYMGDISYVSASTASSDLINDVYTIAGYQTATLFVVVALKPQTISFGAIPAKQYPSTPFALGASASSGLPVSYSVLTGPATVAGITLTLTGIGTVTIQASQSGTGVHASAVNVAQSFSVTAASPIASFRANNGLAADGSQDLLVPAHDGVANLLKYAFNMIGSSAGQAATLSVPNVQIVGVSGTAGLPKPGVNGSGRLTLTYIRRKATSAPGITYAVEFSNTLAAGSWGTNGSASESLSDIDSNFERVTVTDSVNTPLRFARIRVSEN